MSAESDLEQWFGQRGLLGIGILALLAAAGFFLKYSIEHGWIPPAVRAVTSVVAGLAVALWGHRLIVRGMPRYGAPLIGAGGGLVYLGIWAAAGPYALLDRRLGIAVLAVAATALALVALHHEIEALAISALIGAYLAPIILRTATPLPEVFLGFVEVIGISAGVLAVSMRWRRTMAVAVVGYFLLGSILFASELIASDGSSVLARPIGLAFVAFGALLAMQATRHARWPEVQAVGLAAAWVLLLSAADSGGGWLVVAASALVGAAVFWRERGTLRSVPAPDDAVMPGESVLFVLSPFIAVGVVLVIHPAALADTLGVVPVIVAVPYLALGWMRRAARPLAIGFSFLALGAALQWSALVVALAWGALALLAVAGDRWGGRPGLQQVGGVLAGASASGFFFVALPDRPAAAPAFVDSWALGWYAEMVMLALCARWWRGIPARATLRQGLLALAGAMLLAGGSIELVRFFAARPHAELASDLSLSLWWLLFAGALVWHGFRHEWKEERWAGLLVAAAAAAKIAFYDLATLEALYRIASFFALALITLAVAYAYHRRASRAHTTASAA